MAAATAAVVVLSLTTACGSEGTTEAGQAANAFAAAFARQDAKAASDLTTSPALASEALDATFSGMKPREVTADVQRPVEYSDGTASFTMKTTWTWPQDRTYETTTSGTARKLSSGWKVQWDPKLIHENLPTGARLQMVRTDAKPAPSVVSRSGKTFMKMEPVNEISFDPAAAGKKQDAAVNALVRAVAPVAPLVTAKSIRDKVIAAQGQPVLAVSIRESDMKSLTADPERIAGVTMRRSGQLVMDDRRLSTPLIGGLTNYWNAVRDATAGWQVQLAAPGARPQRLAGEQGPPGANIPTTVDQNEQLVLGDTVVEVAQPATVLTLDAGTGAILALAQNDAAAKRRIQADLGYATGTTLDPVFAAVGRATEGANDGDRSANDLLYRFGLGVEFTAPGVSLPRRPAGSVNTAAFHPKDFTASMMNMGALGVSLARAGKGRDDAAAPYLIKGAKTKVAGGEIGGVKPEVAREILGAMARTARTGDASDLTGAPGLRALVGTNGPHGPGWFVGIQGGKVVVVYTEGDKSGTAALQVAQKYFTVSRS